MLANSNVNTSGLIQEGAGQQLPGFIWGEGGFRWDLREYQPSARAVKHCSELGRLFGDLQLAAGQILGCYCLDITYPDSTERAWNRDFVSGCCFKPQTGISHRAFTELWCSLTLWLQPHEASACEGKELVLRGVLYCLSMKWLVRMTWMKKDGNGEVQNWIQIMW